MSLRVLNGTPMDPSSPLCASCKNVWARRDSRGEVTLRCQVGAGHVVRTKITECTSFYPHNEPWLHEYESLAWVWSSGANGEPAFVRLRDLEVGGILRSPSVGFGK